MPRSLSEADPRTVEEVVRGIEGVAFAELETGERHRIHVVLWQGAEADAVTASIEQALQDRLEVRLLPGEIRVAGVASRPPAVPPRVIELGERTWATDVPVEPPPLDALAGTQLPGPEPAGPEPAGPAPAPGARAARRGLLAFEAITVARDRAAVRARVEASYEGQQYTGEASAPATSTGVRRAVCEAALAAAAAALGMVLECVRAEVELAREPVAVVVVATPAGARAAGAALVEADPHFAFARAALQAASALG